MNQSAMTSHEVREWRSVFGWEGIYEVSNLGEVRRIIKGHNVAAGTELKDGWRRCRACNLIWQREYRRKAGAA